MRPDRRTCCRPAAPPAFASGLNCQRFPPADERHELYPQRPARHRGRCDLPGEQRRTRRPRGEHRNPAARSDSVAAPAKEGRAQDETIVRRHRNRRHPKFAVAEGWRKNELPSSELRAFASNDSERRNSELRNYCYGRHSTQHPGDGRLLRPASSRATTASSSSTRTRIPILHRPASSRRFAPR